MSSVVLTDVHETECETEARHRDASTRRLDAVARTTVSTSLVVLGLDVG